MNTLKKNLMLALLAGIFIVSCKKEKNPGPTPEPTPTPTLADKIKDTAVLIARDIYLWYDQIPSSFNGRSYADPNKIMEAIRPFSIEPGFTTAVDRWSFAKKKSEWDNVSGGVAQDFGMNVFFKQEGDLRLRIVEPASPAGLAGIKRGWRITKINGSTNITTSNADFIVNAVYYSATGSFTFQKPDGTSVDLSLTAASYDEKQIMFDSVYTVGDKKVGYMVYNSFLGDTTKTINEFQRIFTSFSSSNVTDVVVDLRYNGGGYVSLQNELANYLVPSSGSSGLMMTTAYNNKLSQYNRSTNFNKKGTLNLARIFFIVSQFTASASELLINNLRPYFGTANEILVGPSRTHGKPVGYINFPVGDWYIFPVLFRTTNKNGEANYFNGFALNNTVADGIDKDWGDVSESCLESVLKFISKGSFRYSVQQPYTEDPIISNTNIKLNPKSFKGMLDLNRPF